LPDRVTLEGEFIFQKINLADQIIGPEPSHKWRNCLD
jgi:hypothetical protein